MKRTGNCNEAGCEEPILASGLCRVHYTRWRNSLKGSCRIDGCERPARNLGLCKTHYERQRVSGNPGGAIQPYRVEKSVRGERVKPGPVERQQWSDWYIDSAGYRVRHRRVDGKSQKQYEHRYVMEWILGRPLLAHENVHHKNGQRADNTPSNLELWSTSQPSGQRVEDKTAWALEWLKIYAPDALIR